MRIEIEIPDDFVYTIAYLLESESQDTALLARNYAAKLAPDEDVSEHPIYKALMTRSLKLHNISRQFGKAIPQNVTQS